MIRLSCVTFLLYCSNVGFCQLDTLTLYEAKIIQLEARKKLIQDSIFHLQVQINQLKQAKMINTLSDSFIEGVTAIEGRVKDKPDVFGNVIGVFKKDTIIKIYDYESNYYLVQFGSLKGYCKLP